jgi:hypothetical protein
LHGEYSVRVFQIHFPFLDLSESVEMRGQCCYASTAFEICLELKGLVHVNIWLENNGQV